MKRIFALILVILIAASVCACGGNSNGGNTDSGEVTALNFKATATDTNPTVMDTFYRNVVGQNFNVDNADVKEVDKKADEMLKKIEDYADTVKAADGCKTYYISNNGDDKNDGLTPETARATYLSTKGVLKSGDCVLFERGGLWRGQWGVVEGVSYGAYGEGIKPRFYGSVDASRTGSGVWETTNTENVYVFSKIISEYCNIVFNNGEAIGRPVQKMDDITKRDYNVVYKAGKVYLYSPNGNPADIWDTIEIVNDPSVIKGTGSTNNGIRIQNLCLMFANFGIASIGNCDGLEIDGCVIGYIGGKDLYLGGISIGNGMEFWGNVRNVKVHDNYVFQCFDAGITHQSNSGMKYSAVEENIEYTDNLVEYCVYSFEAFVSAEHGDNKEFHDRMGKVTISGNISRFAGWGWGYLDRPDKGVPCDLKYKATSHDEPLIISNNIFDRSKLGVYRGAAAEKSLMIFTNNTILLNPKRTFMEIGTSVNMGGDLNAYMAKYFGDFSGTVVKEVPAK